MYTSQKITLNDLFIEYLKIQTFNRKSTWEREKGKDIEAWVSYFKNKRIWWRPSRQTPKRVGYANAQKEHIELVRWKKNHPFVVHQNWSIQSRLGWPEAQDNDWLRLKIKLKSGGMRQ